MGFSTEKTDGLWWLMISNDVNAVRVILSLLPSEKWKEDIPRMVQGALGRQIRGAWDLTLANAWGVLAMEKFSNKFESVPVTGATRASLLKQTQTVDWNTSPKGKVSQFPWPEKKEDLSFSHQGTGKPWLTIQSLAAIPLKEPFSTGYKIKRTMIPIEQKLKNQWSRGDVVRIRLELEAQADQDLGGCERSYSCGKHDPRDRTWKRLQALNKRGGTERVGLAGFRGTVF